MWQWEKLINIFLEYNKKVNLSSFKTEEDVYVKHILDSLEVIEVLKFSAGKSVVDVGTGGGFPLFPLAISYPEVSFVGMDARKKKIVAVESMIGDLGLENVKVVWTRIEDSRKQFDYLTARAVGYIDKLLDRTYGLVKKWWYFCIYKKKSEEELGDLEKICKQKNLTLVTTHDYTLFDEDIDRVIYLLKKN